MIFGFCLIFLYFGVLHEDFLRSHWFSLKFIFILLFFFIFKFLLGLIFFSLAFMFFLQIFKTVFSQSLHSSQNVKNSYQPKKTRTVNDQISIITLIKFYFVQLCFCFQVKIIFRPDPSDINVGLMFCYFCRIFC